MTFNAQQFEQTRMQMPEATVDVPELARFFAEGAKPVWQVRGLKGSEWAKAEAAKRNKKDEVVAQMVAKVQTDAPAKEMADSILAALGEGPGVDPDLIKNRHVMLAGSVSPRLTYKQVKKFSDMYFVPFCRIVAKIMELSGRGPNVEGESIASGGTPGCATPAHTAPGASEGASDSSLK